MDVIPSPAPLQGNQYEVLAPSSGWGSTHGVGAVMGADLALRAPKRRGFEMGISLSR